MKLSQIFDHLTYNTLMNVSIGGLKVGAVNAADYPQLITLTNAGLLDLYTRFALRSREVPIQQQEGQTLYNLHSDYTESSGTAPVKYIVDGTMIHPFTDNLLKIDAVYDEAGDEVPLNDLSRANSVFTPSPTELQIPEASADNLLVVIYRATPDIIDKAETDPATVEVALPYHYMDALTSFIAWKIKAPLDNESSKEGSQHKADYYEAIAMLENKGAVNSDNHSNERFGANGWL